METVEIRIKGQIDRGWAPWLGDLEITHTGDGNTSLTGTVRDQSALYGLLSQLSNLGLQLVSVSSANVDDSSITKEVKR